MTSGLSFRLFRIPFRVQIWFLVTMVLLNYQRLSPFTESPLFVTLWTLQGMVFAAVAVIVHELGHCLAYRRFGQEPSVMLWGLGGITFGQSRLPWKRKLVVSVSGCVFAMLTMGLVGWILTEYVFPSPFGRMVPLSINTWAPTIAEDIWFFAWFWSLVNLLPILPLDGGHVVEALLEWRYGEPRKQIARMVSVVAGAVLGLWGLLVWQNASILLFGWVLAFLNFLPWWQERNNSIVRYQFLPDEDEPGPYGGGGNDANVVSMDKARKKRDRRSPAELVKAGYEALERREYKLALRITDRLQAKRLNAELDRWTAELAAFAWLGDRNPVKAEEVVGALPRSARMSTPLAAVLAVANKRTEDGMRKMVECMVNEPEGGPKLIAVDLFAEYGMIHRLARELVDQPGGVGFEAAVALEGMLHRLHRTQDASTVSDVILLG
jgi:stage IV sporulation protein FB